MEQSNGLHIFLVSLWCGVRAKKLRDSSGFGGYAGQFVGHPSAWFQCCSCAQKLQGKESCWMRTTSKEPIPNAWEAFGDLNSHQNGPKFSSINCNSGMIPWTCWPEVLIPEIWWCMVCPDAPDQCNMCIPGPQWNHRRRTKRLVRAVRVSVMSGFWFSDICIKQMDFFGMAFLKPELKIKVGDAGLSLCKRVLGKVVCPVWPATSSITWCEAQGGIENQVFLGFPAFWCSWGLVQCIGF